MLPASIPPNEQARLAGLAELDIRDTPAEATFDNLTVLAASLVGVPISLITIVDANGQWLKSSHGLQPLKTPQEIAFCADVVHHQRPLIVPDALADQRFADDPLVTGAPHVRFYAGFPLRTPDGFTVGTLCAIDHRPRILTPEQERALTALAAQVVALLELRRSQQRLRAQRQKAVTYGHFFGLSLELFCTIDQTLHFVELNPAWTTAVGWSLEELRDLPLEELLHPDDIAATREVAGRMLRDPASVSNFENRYRHRDGHWVPLSWSGRAEDGVIFATARNLTGARAGRAELAPRGLAARVGHELNNPLSYVLRNLEVATEELHSLQPSSPAEDIEAMREVLREAKSGVDNVIGIVSRLGEGASFGVRLPLAQAPRPVAPNTQVDAALRRGRVLFVEDDESVLKGQVRALTKHHEVFGEHDAREALRRFERGESFDVVFCDLMMPYLAGPELYERVLAIAPAQASRFVFVTGGVTQPGFDAFLAAVPNEQLEKTVGLKVFREVVRRALDGNATP